jgi:hypothetical protein
MSGVFGPTLALSIVLGAIGGIPPGSAPAPDGAASDAPPPVSLPVSASASPAAEQPIDATGTKLKEIGHVRAVTEFCRSALDRTNRSIVLVLENDRRIGIVQNTLRFTDFDFSELSRSKGLIELNEQFVALRAAAVTGNGQMALLKEQLKNSPTDDQRVALLELQRALDGALTRQKRLADRIGRMIVMIQNHDRIDEDTRAQEQFEANLTLNQPGSNRDPVGGSNANIPWSLTEGAKQDADDVAGWEASISHDENDASDRLDAAFSGC